jgi:hypothetical protein
MPRFDDDSNYKFRPVEKPDQTLFTALFAGESPSHFEREDNALGQTSPRRRKREQA